MFSYGHGYVHENSFSNDIYGSKKGSYFHLVKEEEYIRPWLEPRFQVSTEKLMMFSPPWKGKEEETDVPLF